MGEVPNGLHFSGGQLGFKDFSSKCIQGEHIICLHSENDNNGKKIFRHFSLKYKSRKTTLKGYYTPGQKIPPINHTLLRCNNSKF